MEAFAAWALEQGVLCEAAEMTQSETEGLGLVARTQLPEDAAVVTVPLGATLHVQPQADAALATLFTGLHRVHALALTLCTASAAGGKRDLAPWLALWSTQPLGGWGLSEEEWAALAWCTDLTTLHEQQDADAKQAYHEQICPYFSEHGDASACPSWERFVWAVSMVLSRAMNVDMSGEERLVLTPYVDLLNHRAYQASNARLSFELAEEGGGGRIVVRTRSAVAAGEPLTITYGCKPNAELLAAYGFAMADNPHEEATLRIALPSEDPLRAQRLAMLPGGMGRADGDALSGSFGWEEGAGEGGAGEPSFPPELLLLLGVASAADVAALFGALSGAGGGPAVWELLASCCEAQLEQLDAPAAQDGAKASASVNAAVAARRGLLARAVQRARELAAEP